MQLEHTVVAIGVQSECDATANGCTRSAALLKNVRTTEAEPHLYRSRTASLCIETQSVWSTAVGLQYECDHGAIRLRLDCRCCVRKI
jgi:hypothetical protein